jgi:mevalonate kinase
MNGFDVRQYFISKYEDTFQEDYVSNKSSIESFLLKQLLNKYKKYLLLEAIDKFFATIKKDKASILLFVSNKFFPSFFEDLIKEKDIIQYQRMLPWYSSEDQSKIHDLMRVYKSYLYALSLSQDEIDEMPLILEKLKNIQRIS